MIVSGFRAALGLDTYPLSNLIWSYNSGRQQSSQSRCPRSAERAKPGVHTVFHTVLKMGSNCVGCTPQKVRLVKPSFLLTLISIDHFPRVWKLLHFYSILYHSVLYHFCIVCRLYIYFCKKNSIAKGTKNV